MPTVPTLNIDALFGAIYEFIQYVISGDLLFLWDTNIAPKLTLIGIILSLFFIAGIVYCNIRLSQIRKIEALAFEEATIHFDSAAMAGEREATNERWEHILELAASNRPADWRVAILEADIMLDAMLTAMGHEGVSVGEKLKQVEQSDFTSLSAAWEAHKVRNQIAHDGSDFELTEQTKKRTIEFYRQAFEEFKYI